MADEYISGVVSLLHFNGANGSTSFKDSATALNWTPSGDAVISTEQSKFGGSAFYKPAAGEHCLSTQSTADLNIGTYDFTIELWVYPLALYDFAFMLTKWGNSNYSGFSLGFMADGGLFANCTSSGCGFVGVPNTVVTNQWQHIALTRMGGTVRVFVDGVMKHTWSNGGDMTNDQPVRIGGYESNQQFTGYIDEVRITKGQCRYVSDFTPQTTPFDNPPQWWTAAPNLTPIAAWDAARVNGAQLLDGVGGNHITATSELTRSDYPFVGVAGNGNPMTLATPVPIPSVGVVAGFWSPQRRNVLLSKDGSGNGYVLHLSDDGNRWFSNNGSYAPYGQYGNIGRRYFVAMVTRDTDSILYVDGNPVGNPLSSSYTMSHIGQVGYQGYGNEYNLDADEFLHAIGVWTGEATQDDVKAIEAAARLALKGVGATNRGFPAPIGRTDSNLPQLTLSTPAPQRFVGANLTRRDYQFGGNGRISGTVKEKGTPDQPLQRRVQLYDETSKVMTREVWSDPITGDYIFENIDPKLTYTVISYDYTGKYRAVIANYIKTTI